MDKFWGVANFAILTLHNIALVLSQMVALILPFVGLAKILFFSEIITGTVYIIISFFFAVLAKDLNGAY